MRNKTLTQSAEDFRSKVLKDTSADKFDLIVIGGGITGAGILREAARRGLKVLLLEQKDFAWGTSSRSSKMVHGGLRYLGEGQIRLTRESVRERQRYLTELPGLVNVMRYLMVHKPKQFPPRWIFQILLGVYDFFAGKKYRQSVDAQELPSWLGPIHPGNATGGSVFADAVTDDSRLVLRTLSEAVGDGGVAVNYAEVSELLKDDDDTVTGVQIRDLVKDAQYSVMADTVVNATGAWAAKLGGADSPEVRPLRGSHLVVPFWRLPVSCSISMIHPKDDRPVFVFPWQGAAVIGTTDLDHKPSLNDEASISQEEVDYLLEGANYYLSDSKISESDVISTWAGVRPVISSGKGLDPSREKREHSIWQQPGLITVSGGKLTTFRVIALDVLSRLPKAAALRRTKDFGQPFFRSTLYVMNQIGRLSGRVKRRLSGRYGFEALDLIDAMHSNDKAEYSIGHSDTSWLELEWAIKHESVVHLDDLLFRRTRIGNVMPDLTKGQWRKIQELFEEHQGWSEQKWCSELSRYQDIWRTCYAVPSLHGVKNNSAQSDLKEAV
ncbi:glycerol-3-phosphate dehydrogenase/oxidase [Litoribacillus peritrichatus]|uniref:Glycerol-3-phosphate dehydrogenase/oxidase n=1 Tax=Litoribacillus peritrichatus TaxID=718191 RepID=A0ABP7MD71_9GAMM